MALAENLVSQTVIGQNQPNTDAQGGEQVPLKFREDWVAYGKKKFEELREERMPIELRALLVMNFIAGNQFCDIVQETHSIKQFARRYEWESREVFNKMAPIFEARIAALTAVQPAPYVRPATGESSDMASAKISVAVARDIEEYNDMQNLRARAVAWAEICGTSFIKTTWDTEAGDDVGSDELGYVKSGYVRKDLVPMFEFFPYSATAPGIERLRGCIHAKAFPVEEVNEKYNVALRGGTVDVFSMSLTGVGYGGLGFRNTSPTVEKTEKKDQVVVCELMELPSKRFPKGVVITWAGDTLLEFKEMCYYVGERNTPSLPYEQYTCVTNPASFWGDSIMWRLIPLQRAYNAVRNKKFEALNRKAIGNLAVEDDGYTTKEELEEEGTFPGKVFMYPRGGQPPKFIHDSISTSDFDAEEVRLSAMFVEISGLSQFASHGAVQSGIESGSAIEKIREQDTARISLTIGNINRAAVRGFKIGLRLCRQYAQGPRIIRMVGANDEVAVKYWFASQLTSDDVIIDKETTAMQSAAERRQTIRELLQYRLFDKEIDKKTRMQILRAMNFGDWENIDAREKLHTNRALRENEKIKAGMVPVAKEYDDHDLHMDEHDRQCLESEWEELSEKDPELEARMEAHKSMHKQFIQKELMNRMAAMAPPQAPQSLQAAPQQDEQQVDMMMEGQG